MEKIINKVKKLISLGTNDGATDGERDNAIRMAHGLLAKHNLSMVDLEESIEERVKQFSEYSTVPWTGTAANAIAKLFFCYLYMENKPANEKGTGSKRKYFFIGKESNVITAILMADYIIKTIVKEQKKNGYSRSFCNGAAQKVAQRVLEIINSATIQDGESTCTDLAIISIYKSEEQANKEFAEKTAGKLVAAKSRATANNASDYLAGNAYGNGISLNGQISGSKSKTQRLN